MEHATAPVVVEPTLAQLDSAAERIRAEHPQCETRVCDAAGAARYMLSLTEQVRAQVPILEGILGDSIVPDGASVLVLNRQDVSTILAALRFYQAEDQGQPILRPDWLHAIATGGEDAADAPGTSREVISMDFDGIGDLCERVNAQAGQYDTDEEHFTEAAS